MSQDTANCSGDCFLQSHGPAGSNFCAPIVPPIRPEKLVPVSHSTQVQSRQSGEASWPWGEVAARPQLWAGPEGGGAWLPRIPNGPMPAASAGAAVAAVHGENHTFVQSEMEKRTPAGVTATEQDRKDNWKTWIPATKSQSFDKLNLQEHTSVWWCSFSVDTTFSFNEDTPSNIYFLSLCNCTLTSGSSLIIAAIK